MFVLRFFRLNLTQSVITSQVIEIASSQGLVTEKKPVSIFCLGWINP